MMRKSGIASSLASAVNSLASATIAGEADKSMHWLIKWHTKRHVGDKPVKEPKNMGSIRDGTTPRRQLVYIGGGHTKKLNWEVYVSKRSLRGNDEAY
jgi:hypothetical protein